MSQLVYLVTGANKSIGYEAMRILAKRLGRDAVILLGTRSIENGKAAIEKMRQSDPSVDFANVHPIELDVTKASSPEAAVEHVKTTYGSLHVLINNAGMFEDLVLLVKCALMSMSLVCTIPSQPSIPSRSQKARLTLWLLRNMGLGTALKWHQSSKLSSTNLSNWTKLNSKRLLKTGWRPPKEARPGTKPDVASPIEPYGTSKTMVIAVTRKWAADHPEIKTMMVCPGWCATDLNNNNGPRQATQGGESVVFPIFNPDLTSTGGFYRDGLVHSFNTPRPAPQDYK
ncbi:hypothetical protein AeNC1_013185 [Aphanomyces euteiches]|nr:hypothetical protein AeNC1_013185 [Aphanomyces euteiches]